MAYQPWYVGQTYPPLDIPLNTDNGPDNIVGILTSNLTMVIHSSSGNDTTGSGTFVIKNSNPAEITYQFSTADVAVAGNFNLFVKAVFPGGGVAIYDPIPFTITAT